MFYGIKRERGIVDELLAVKSRSKGNLLRRAALVIGGLRSELDHERSVCEVATKENRRVLAVVAQLEGERNVLLEELTAMRERESRILCEAVLLKTELQDERYRHDRVQDFCVAQGLDLEAVKEALKKTMDSCEVCAHGMNKGDECEGDCECCTLDCTCKDCRNSSKWEWRGMELPSNEEDGL